MQAVVLAGGFGTRLRARIADVPKPMAPVAGRPFLDYVLDQLDRTGCQRVVLATGHLSEVIERHVGQRYGSMEVIYSHEATPLGTGGAVVQALARLPGGPTLVLNGDTWLGLDIAGFSAWCAQVPTAPAIVLREVADTARFGRVTLQGDQVLSFGEKSQAGPGLINAGVYCLQREAFAPFALPQAFSIETDFFAPHALTLGLRGFITAGHFIDIGVPEDYDRAQTALPMWAAG